MNINVCACIVCAHTQRQQRVKGINQMFIIASCVFIVACVVATYMFIECEREQINVDRYRYCTLNTNERQIAQTYDARLMSRRSMR